MTFEEQETEVTTDIQVTEDLTEVQPQESEEIEEFIEEYENLLEAYTAQNEKLETIIESQADVILLLEQQNTKLIEMNQYTAYIFAALVVYGLYRFVSGVLSSMFGGG